MYEINDGWVRLDLGDSPEGDPLYGWTAATNVAVEVSTPEQPVKVLEEDLEDEE